MLTGAERVAVTTLTAVGQGKRLPKGYVPRGPIIVKV